MYSTHTSCTRNEKKKLDSLSNIEGQHLLTLKEPFDVLSNLQWAYAHRSTCKKEIPSLEHKELTYVTNQLIYAKKHICRVSLLYGITIDIEAETDVLHMSKALNRDKIAQHSRAIESLAELPRKTLTAEALLHITGCDVNAYSYRIVVAMSKAWSDILAELIDTHHQFGLIIETLCKIRDKKRFSSLENRRVRLHKYHRSLGKRSCSVQLSMVFGIVHAYANNLHARMYD